MTSIKFNEEYIDIDKDNSNNINISDLNIFTNENFNFIKENPNYYETINISKFDFTANTSNTKNYKKLYNNYIYANKINNYNTNLLTKIFKSNNIVLNRNEDNIINSISLHYKNNHINNFHQYLYDIENKNIEIKIINQYLYYMNIYFTNKYNFLQNNLKLQKDKYKIVENHINYYKSQDTDIRYIKYKINNHEDKLIHLENKIEKLNNHLFYLSIISLLFMINIFKDNFI